MGFMGKTSIFFALCSAALVLLLAPTGRTESAQKLKATEAEIREQMLRITKELGTTCTECHKVSDFKDGAKPSYQVASRHLKLVAVMKANGFDGKKDPEANCFMCHRGQLKALTGQQIR